MNVSASVTLTWQIRSYEHNMKNVNLNVLFTHFIHVMIMLCSGHISLTHGKAPALLIIINKLNACRNNTTLPSEKVPSIFNYAILNWYCSTCLSENDLQPL